MQTEKKAPFTPYERLVILILAFTQFTIILDFMVMSPLGDMLIKAMDIRANSFALAVSAYAFSAGASGLLTAGFADKYDRKKLLLFFYIGFVIGTLLCGLANTLFTLVAARVITGLFGGVIGAISMAIITDLFTLEKRGRVMGVVQMGFGASQVLGIPIGLFIANRWGWEMPFFMISVLAILIVIAISCWLRPVTEHLALQSKENSLVHLYRTIDNGDYRIGMAATALLSIGGFMLMPYATVFAVNNLGISHEQLPVLFMVSGCFSLVMMPALGKLSDRIDKYKLFAIASIGLMFMSIFYTQLGPTPFWVVLVFNVLITTTVIGRMVPSTALVSAVPEQKDRGAFMSINSSLQQIAGGVGATIAGMLVSQAGKDSVLAGYNYVGIVVACVSCISLLLLYLVKRIVMRKSS
ncbi:MAG: MFS transporter [Pseudosphingobacterium sp.]|nr:MFS transporter [Olivibacter sp. UJ_SKK_5.1]MDX3916598.1 MFS transporter [Pseudosphingobacterium sp.]